MSKCMGQWEQLANKDLILCRRRLWMFYPKFESFKNHLHRIEIKMNKKAKELQELYDEHAGLILQGNEILAEIDDTEGQSNPYVTAPAQHEFPFLRWSIRDVSKPPDHWSHFEVALKSGSDGGMAALAQIKGANSGKSSQHTFMAGDEKKDWHEDFKHEETGNVSIPVRNYKDKQSGSKKGRHSNN